MKYLVRNLFPTLKELSVVRIHNNLSGDVWNYRTKRFLSCVQARLVISVVSIIADVTRYRMKADYGFLPLSNG